MALFKSQVLTQASGSVAGLTYSRGRSGLVLRNRTIPVNTQTARQSAVRNALTTLVIAWIETLTAAQRAAWELYAANVPVTNALGDSRNISGQNWFIAANTPRIQFATLGLLDAPIIPTAPRQFDRGDFHTPTFVADAAAGITVTFDPTDDFNSDTDQGLLWYMHRPHNSARRTSPNHKRALMSINDGATSPVNIAASFVASQAFPLNSGNAISLSFVQTLNTGKLSTIRTIGPQLVT